MGVHMVHPDSENLWSPKLKGRNRTWQSESLQDWEDIGPIGRRAPEPAMRLECNNLRIFWERRINAVKCPGRGGRASSPRWVPLQGPRPFVMGFVWVWNVDQSWQVFSVKGQVVNICSFGGQTVFSHLLPKAGNKLRQPTDWRLPTPDLHCVFLLNVAWLS